MAEETTPQTGSAEKPASDTKPEGDTKGESQEEDDGSRSPEDIEAYWKKRQSQEAAAASAREKVLRDEAASLKAQVEANRVDTSKKSAAEMTEADRLREENVRLQEQVKQTKEQAAVETRKAKYPDAAANLDESALSVMDEATLAGLNEKLKPVGGSSSHTIIDPSQPGRPQQQQSKSLKDKTSAELKKDLEGLSEGFAEQLR